MIHAPFADRLCRRPLLITCSALALLGAAPLMASNAAASKRPNVLFVVSDDLSSRITPAGYRGVQTPVLDRLATESTTFLRAYCQYPVCGPSRASFLSGLYPESTGVFDNRIHIQETRPGTESLPRLFRRAGYWTGAVGKVFHEAGDNPGGDTWDEVKAFENDELEIERSARARFEQQHGAVTLAKNRAAWRALHSTLAPQTRNQGVKGLGPGYGPSGLRDEQHSDGKNARTVAAWITQQAHGERPFMIACGFQKPHIPFLAPEAYFDQYPRAALDLVRPPADDWKDIPSVAGTKQYLDYGFPPLGEENEARRRQFMQAYYACISFVDAQLGIILDALKKSGQWDNTIIVFVGDNGYSLGEHFMWGKVLLFEESARIPVLVRLPGVTRGAASRALVELVDLFPTLAELCAVPTPKDIQGRSLLPLLRDASAPGKAWAYTVVRRGHELGRAVRFGKWRYAEWGRPEVNELYDLEADPGEWTNLAHDPASADVVQKAQTVLKQAQEEAERAKRPSSI